MKRRIILFLALLSILIEFIALTRFFQKRAEGALGLRTAMQNGKYYLYDDKQATYIETDRKTWLSERSYFSFLLLVTIVGTMSFIYLFYLAGAALYRIFLSKSKPKGEIKKRGPS